MYGERHIFLIVPTENGMSNLTNKSFLQIPQISTVPTLKKTPSTGCFLLKSLTSESRVKVLDVSGRHWNICHPIPWTLLSASLQDLMPALHCLQHLRALIKWSLWEIVCWRAFKFYATPWTLNQLPHKCTNWTNSFPNLRINKPPATDALNRFSWFGSMTWTWKPRFG